MDRDPSYEIEFVRQVAREAGLSGLTEEFSAAVFERLRKGGEEYGDNSFAEKGEELLKEAAEEAIDLPAWVALYGQVLLERQRTGTDPEGEQMKMMWAIKAAAHSLKAWYALKQALEA